MKLALDTNRYSDLHRGDTGVAAMLEKADWIYLLFAALAELYVGFAGGSRGKENERVLRKFLARPGVSVLHGDADTARFYSQIYHDLRTRGKPIPVNDMWIAALCLQHNLVLYARDAHFRNLPQLQII